MAQFGVGRPAVREAMQALANIGLIGINHGERARVRQVSPATAIRQVDTIAKLILSTSPHSLEHLKEARGFFERGMVRVASTKATNSDIADLRQLWEQQRDARGDADAFIEADMAFHNRIAKISGNPIYSAISEMMLHWLREYHSHLLIWEGRADQTLSEHDKIISLIENHDVAGAEEAMTGHLERTEHLYVHTDSATP